MKVEFYVCMVDKRYHRAKFQADSALDCGDTALCLRSCHTPLRNYDPKALLCTRKAFPHTTRDPEIN